MAFTTTPAPGPGQTVQAVITIVGPKTEERWTRFTTELKDAVERIGGSIGVRGMVETATGTFIYPPGQGPKK